MISLIAAAIAAAQPAVPATPPAQHGGMMQPGQMEGMDGQTDHSKMGEMANMKDCCCHEMMSKMHSDHMRPGQMGEGHSGH